MNEVCLISTKEFSDSFNMFELSGRDKMGYDVLTNETFYSFVDMTGDEITYLKNAARFDDRAYLSILYNESRLEVYGYYKPVKFRANLEQHLVIKEVQNHA